MKEKSLSEDIELARQSGYNEACYIKDKEFKKKVKKLKEECLKRNLDCIFHKEEHTIMWEIDKIFGEELGK